MSTKLEKYNPLLEFPIKSTKAIDVGIYSRDQVQIPQKWFVKQSG